MNLIWRYFSAIASRCIFVAHSVYSIHEILNRIYMGDDEKANNSAVWTIVIMLGLILIEGVYTLIIRKGNEYKQLVSYRTYFHIWCTFYHIWEWRFLYRNIRGLHQITDYKLSCIFLQMVGVLPHIYIEVIDFQYFKCQDFEEICPSLLLFEASRLAKLDSLQISVDHDCIIFIAVYCLNFTIYGDKKSLYGNKNHITMITLWCLIDVPPLINFLIFPPWTSLFEPPFWLLTFKNSLNTFSTVLLFVISFMIQKENFL